MRPANTWLLPLVVLLGGCDVVFGLAPHDAPIDAPIDAPPPMRFSDPVPLLGINTMSLEEDDASLTGDLLEIYFLRNSAIWTSRRETVQDAWASPSEVVGAINTMSIELRPSVSRDGLTLYFARGPQGQRDILRSTRETRGGAWGEPIPLLLDLNDSAESEELPGWSSPDGRQLIVEHAKGTGNHDLYLATRAENGHFTSEPLTALNEVSNEGGGWATDDLSSIVFESRRAGDVGIWEAVRDGGGWSVYFHEELDSPGTDGTPWLSPDGRTIVFSSNRAAGGGTDDLYIAWR